MKNKCLIYVLLLVLGLFINVNVNGEKNKTIKKINMKKEKNILLEKDRALSKTSAENGILNALLPHLTDRSMIFPGEGCPVRGKEACDRLIDIVDMKGWEWKIKWVPTMAVVSAAGDIGYTHGRFDRPNPDPKSDKKTITGLYATIWQKDAKGLWKVAISQGLVLLEDLGQDPAPKEFDEAALDKLNKEVVTTESAFSKHSVESGRLEAFHHYIDANGFAIGGNVIKTKDAYAKLIADEKEKKDATKPKTTLEWEPYYSYVSTSGDLAFDWGPWKYSISNPDGNTQEFYGYFITVWKKQPDKTWKFVLDCGNDCSLPVKK